MTNPPVSQYLFISDLHLGQGDREKDQRRMDDFIAWLRTCVTPGTHLVLVGDCFEFWFDYREAIPSRHFKVLATLRELRDQGIPITFFAGNHDYWLGPWLERELGVQFASDDLTMDLAGQRVWVHHGDGLRSSERGYRLMKHVLRSPLCIWLFRWIHPDIGLRFGYRWSRESNARSREIPHITAEYETVARNKFAEGYDVVILGHTHRLDIRRLAEGTFIQLGEWIDGRSYLRFNEQGFALCAWDGKTQADYT
jgi:UDP-2,3-diacylglucosamine hydrolase